MLIIPPLLMPGQNSSPTFRTVGQAAPPPAVRTPLTMSRDLIRQCALDIPDVQGMHSVFELGLWPGWQLPQDFLKHIAGVSDVLEGTATA
ncbi:hypothetical protein [Streptomyces sp. enrichment culture]|uniref:hypothetical protein n=1 Tax=Streptomyces sp. enrichment culture TaxID=1795815 RepID=UPI003F56FF03